jgi:hypothetical protein
LVKEEMMSIKKKEVYKMDSVEIHHLCNDRTFVIYFSVKNSSDKMISLTCGEMAVLTEMLKEINYEG